MRTHTTRYLGGALLGIVGLAMGSCTQDATQADVVTDVVSELPGEIRFSGYSAGDGSPTLECLSPANLTMLEPAGARTPVEVSWATNVAAELRAGAYKLAWYDNGEREGLQGTTDPVTLKLPFGDHLVTLALLGQDGNDVQSPTARCSLRIRVTKPCASDAECTDQMFCGETTCASGPTGIKQCAFGDAPYAGCCQQKFECAFGELCDTGAHLCVACLEDLQCDDGDELTADTCVKGTCLSEPVALPVVGAAAQPSAQPTVGAKAVPAAKNAVAEVKAGATKVKTALPASLASCNDGLACTKDVQDAKLGCVSTVSDGGCLIGGVCYGEGAANPSNVCGLCASGLSRTSWTPGGGAAESCDGIDNDCNGSVDEGVQQACKGSCGKSGLSTCDGGSFVLCDAPVGAELCGDGKDNDCNGAADEAGCLDAGQPGVDLAFDADGAYPGAGLVDNGDGTYTKAFYGISAPNTAGTARATAGTRQAPTAWSVRALPAARLDMVVSRREIFADSPRTDVHVQVTDAAGRPVATGTEVVVTTDRAFSCQTDAYGRCHVTATFARGAFARSDSLTVSAEVAGLPIVTSTVVAMARPAALELDAWQTGLELPLTPVFDRGDTFEVPIFASAGALSLGAYDVSVRFDPSALEVVSVLRGDAAFMDPVSNVGTELTRSGGVVRLNGVVKDARHGPSGSRIHLATLELRARATAATTTLSTLTATATLVDTANTTRASDAVALLRDGQGVAEAGALRIDQVTVAGLLVRAESTQLLAWEALTGASDATHIDVTGVLTDGTLIDLSTNSGIAWASSDESILTLARGGVATAHAGASREGGHAVVTATYGDLAAEVGLDVLAPHALAAQLSDATLQAIEGYPAPARLQTARLAVLATWHRGGKALFTTDVTDRVTVSGKGLTWDSIGHALSGSVDGEHAFDVVGAAGKVLTSGKLTIDSTRTARITALQVVAPCSVETVRVEPANPSPALGKALMTVTVSGRIASRTAACQARVYATFDDGNRMDVTGDPNVELASSDEKVLGAARGGLLEPRADGAARVRATLRTTDGRGLASGETAVQVQLPGAVGLTLRPANIAIAVDATDAAATLKGLPPSARLSATVHYADGSTSDLAGSRLVKYTVVGDALQCSDRGVCTAQSAGSARIIASVGSLSAEARVEAVKAAGLRAQLYEPTTAVLPRIIDHTFSHIEGTTTWQDGTFEVLMDFSDGSVLDVTDRAQMEARGVLSFDAKRRTVTALAAGTADLVASVGGLTARLPGVVVEESSVDIVSLSAKLPTTTLSGIKDAAVATLDVLATFADGTHRRLSGKHSIDGLLKYRSSELEAAAVDAEGRVTARANRSVLLAVELRADRDTGEKLAAGAEVAADVNLLPAVGDLDLGDEDGLAFKDRTVGEIFTIEGRVNTGEAALGAFDAAITFDPDVLEVLGVSAGADIQGAIFSSNAQSKPGELLVNATLGTLVRTGPAVRVLAVTFRAKKGGSGKTAIGGTLRTMVANDAKTHLGEKTPRAIVAGDGAMDPNCPEEVIGDANDDCVFGAEDGLFIQRYLAGLETPTAQQLLNMNAYPDGDVSVGDALFESQVLAKLVPFVEMSIEKASTVAGDADVVVLVTDRDQIPVTKDLTVTLEFQVTNNFSNLKVDKPGPAAIDPASKLAIATQDGLSGVYRVTISGLLTKTTVSVSAIVSTINPTTGGIIKTVAFLGSRELPNGTFKALKVFDVPLVAAPDVCASDSECDAATAYCDNIVGPGTPDPTFKCQPKKDDGMPCAKTSVCISNHCQNTWCCASGDCCSAVGDCPSKYAVPSACQNTATCAGTRKDPTCVQFMCGSTPVDDDKGCGPSLVASDCGCYSSISCNGQETQSIPTCPTTCTADGQCDGNCHCDGTCDADVPNGGTCDEDSDCIGGHCTNNVCCDTGSCCKSDAQCASMTSPSACNSPTTCQGQKTVGLCNKTKFQCASAPVDDDTACAATTQALSCGCGTDQFCKGTIAQTPPTCPVAGCTGENDNDCKASCHCDATSCLADLPDGSACNEGSDCVSGYCNNGFCCINDGTNPVCCGGIANCPVETFTKPSACFAGSAKYDTGFSSTQGQNQWRYELSNAATGYTELAWNGTSKWTGANGAEITKTTLHPATSDGVSLCYDVRGSGEVRLNGTLTDGDPSGGDGVTVQIRLNGDTVFNADLPDGGTLNLNQKIDVTVLDKLRIVILPKVSNANDTTNIALTIVLSTCQGEKYAATCSSSKCGTTPVADDTGCATTLTARNCAPYKNVVCDGTADQTEPACPESCNNKNDLTINGACVDNTPICNPEFEEGEGTTCGDHSGNGFGGHLIGLNLPKWVAGILGWALQFGQFGIVGGPIDNCVTLDGSATLQFPLGFSVGAWLNWGGPGISGPQIAIGKGGSWGLGINYKGGVGHLSFHINGDFGAGSIWDLIGSLTPAMPIGVPVHVAATFDGFNISIFMNGALVALVPYVGVLPYASLEPIVFGQYGVGVPSLTNFMPFLGIIDGVSITDFPFSPSQVVGLVKGFGLPPKVNLCNFALKPPISWLYFEEGLGTVASAAAGLLGKLNGALTWVSGRFCKGINFSGLAGQFIKLVGGASVNFQLGFSVGGWFKWAGGAGVQWLFSKFGSFGIGIEGGKLFLQVVDAVSGQVLKIFSDVSINIGSWTHAFGVFDGKFIYLYLNGRIVAKLPCGLIKMTVGDLIIGQLDIVAPNIDIGIFKGVIDEFVVVDYPLLATDVIGIMIGVVPATGLLSDLFPPHPFSYLTFDGEFGGGGINWGNGSWKIGGDGGGNGGKGINWSDGFGTGWGGSSGTGYPSFSFDGKWGGCLSFDGNFAGAGGALSKCLSLAASAALDFSTGLTLGAYINWAGGAGIQAILSKAGQFLLGIKDGKLFLTLNDSAGTIDLCTALGISVPTGVWTHVGATWDGAGKISLYIDGEFKGSVSFSGSLSAGFGTDVFLGQGGKAGGTLITGINLFPFIGKIDEVSVLDKPCVHHHLVQMAKGLVVEPFEDVGIAKRADGNPCPDDLTGAGACQSNYCNNKICCGGAPSGVCCAHVGQCPGLFTKAAACKDGPNCQGDRGDAMCSTFLCGTNTVDDDRGCTATTLANDCGCYPSEFCNGQADQLTPACDATCSLDGDCDSGCHCDGGCIDNAPNGTACDEASDCKSGFCVDGVCCNVACAGTCAACDVAGAIGTCTAIAQGEDPANECAGTGQCGGTCNGAMACAYPATSVDCGTCRRCDGLGACGLMNALGTDPDADCPLCQVCNGTGGCKDAAKGTDVKGECAESATSTCQTDGVCSGTGTCELWISGTVCKAQTCVAGTLKPASTCDGLGTCVDKPTSQCAPFICNGTSCGSGCTSDAQCDSTAYCKVPGNTCTPKLDPGGPCSGNTQCASGFCVDGVCCTSSCTGLCARCDLTATKGTCSPVGDGDDPNNECAGTGTCGGTCNGSGQCKYPATSLTCGTCVHCDGLGACAQNVPANSDPDGQCGFCEVCDGTGKCAKAAVGTDPKGHCAQDPQSTCARDGECDGTGACRKWASGTECKAPECLTGIAYTKRVCDGLGVCKPPTQTPCDPYICGPNACLSTCTTDAQCITADWCSGTSCIVKKPNGDPCTGNNQCGSNFCVDGVCCESSCNTTCKSCALPTKLGKCSPIALDTDPADECPLCQTCNGAGACANVVGGSDPLDECALTPATGCGNDGTCNGSGACRKWVNGTICVDQTCAAGVVQLPDTCNGTGSCVDGGNQQCTPYFCNGSVCDDQCASDTECVSTNWCKTPFCDLKKDNGQPCGAGNECKSAFCADGVCCNTSCTSNCAQCNLVGTTGACTSHTSGTDPEVGCGDYFCNGLGACSTTCSADKDCKAGNWCNGNVCEDKKPNGDPCSGNNQCNSAFCIDGVCCDVACGGKCQACNLTGFVGKCSLVPANQDPAEECTGTGTCGGTCNGGGACQFPSATLTCGTCRRCTGAGACGFVAVNLDPDKTCALCQACDGNGVCKSAPVGTDVKNECTSSSSTSCGLTGNCDGGASPACQFWDTTTICKSEVCTGVTHEFADKCSGAGSCADGGTENCSPYICGSVKCKTSCATQAECVTDYYCKGASVCVPKKINGDSCADGFECKSSHCQNGFCCATGDCCAANSDCTKFNVAPKCTNVATCTGSRTDFACNGNKECFSTVVSDPIDCDGKRCAEPLCTGTDPSIQHVDPKTCNNAGACSVGGALQTCNDGNVCTDNACALEVGCGFTNNAHAESCYGGPALTLNVGECHAGTKTCSGGAFGPCVGQVMPVGESCNLKDDDCDATTDEEDAAGCSIFFYDGDGDTFGVTGNTKCLCKATGYYTADKGGDCADGDKLVYPGQTEACNGKDDNCNNIIDEDGATGCTVYYRDNDQDGYGQTLDFKCKCAALDPYDTTKKDDCDDAVATTYPTAPELCNTVGLKNADGTTVGAYTAGVDDDCDGLTDEGYNLAGACDSTTDTDTCLEGRLICAPGDPTKKSTSCITDGAVVMLSADRIDGNTAVNEAGPTLDGTMTGNITTMAGKTGKAFDVSGGGYVSVPNDAIRMKVGATGATFAYWVKSSGTPLNYAAQHVHKATATTDATIAMYHFGAGNGAATDFVSPYFTVGGTWASCGGFILLPADGWVHIAVTYDYNATANTTNVRLYKNAVQNASCTFAGAIYDNTAPLQVGRGWQQPFNGGIDEFVFYTYPLAKADITALMTKVPDLVRNNEICDTKDNTCEGTADEGFTGLGTACTEGVAPCDQSGLKQCSSSGLKVQCSVRGKSYGVACNDSDLCSSADQCTGDDKPYIRVRVFAKSAGYKGNYSVQYSDDDEAWFNAATGFIPALAGWNETSWAAAGTHRYWRLYLTNTPGAGSWLDELEWYAKPTSVEVKDTLTCGKLTPHSLSLGDLCQSIDGLTTGQAWHTDTATAGAWLKVDLRADSSTSKCLGVSYTCPGTCRACDGNGTCSVAANTCFIVAGSGCTATSQADCGSAAACKNNGDYLGTSGDNACSQCISATSNSAWSAAATSHICVAAKCDAAAANLCVQTTADAQPVTLTCGSGRKISSVVFASYGTPNGTCAGGDLRMSTCHSPNSVSKIETACLGKTTCSFTADSAFFGGDPCSGKVKKLSVEVRCGGEYEAADYCGSGANAFKCVDVGFTACDDKNLCSDDNCADATGCSHVNNAFQRQCYTGPANSLNIGTCSPGIETCASGAFGSCNGEVKPVVESCAIQVPGEDGLDNNCDGLVDNIIDFTTWYLDNDADNHGNTGSTKAGFSNPVYKCLQPSGYSNLTDDCDDADARNFPGNTEVCDDQDNNCAPTANPLAAGNIDEAFGTKGTTCDSTDADSCAEGHLICKKDMTGVECENSDGPIGVWDFDYGNFQTVPDSSGNGHNLTGFGGMQIVSSGKVNRGAYFDGVDDYARDSVFGTYATPDGTISVWVKPDDLAAGVDHTIVGSMGSGDANGCCWRWRLNTVGANAVFQLWDGDNSTITSNTTLTVGTWAHLLVTWKGDATVYGKTLPGVATMYVNGVKQTQTSAISSVGAFGYLELGAVLWTGVPTLPFKGTIDEVAVYPTAKTAAEITALAGAAGIPALERNREYCDGKDNDCKSNIDETFPAKGTACTAGGDTECRQSGTQICHAEGLTTTCNVTGKSAGTACNDGSLCSFGDACSGAADLTTAAGPFAGGSDATNPVADAFDNLTTTSWKQTVAAPWTIGFNFRASTIIDSYSLTPDATVSDMPKSWTFEAHDGVKWNVLDTQSNQVFTASTKKTYAVTNTTGYLQYRLNISAGTLATAVRLPELELMNAGTDLASVPFANKFAQANPPINLFDDSSATTWSDTTGATWNAGFDFGSGKIIGSYSLTPTATVTSMPMNWTLEGAIGTGAWQVIDIRNNETFVASTKKTYSFTNSTAFTKYRLNVSAVASGTTITVAEMELISNGDDSSCKGTNYACAGTCRSCDGTATSGVGNCSLAGTSCYITGGCAPSVSTCDGNCFVTGEDPAHKTASHTSDNVSCTYCDPSLNKQSFSNRPASWNCQDPSCNGVVSWNPTDYCNGGGTCLNASAQGCDDSNICTNDNCVGATGCTHTNNTVLYDGACYTGSAATKNVGLCKTGQRFCLNGGPTPDPGGCVGEVKPVAEVCDGKDNDCDNVIDNGVLITFYRDVDGDGHGDPNVKVQACTPPAGYVASGDDCVDSSPTSDAGGPYVINTAGYTGTKVYTNKIFPGQPELCNDVDDNCAGSPAIDESYTDKGTACDSTGTTGDADLCTDSVKVCRQDGTGTFCPAFMAWGAYLLGGDTIEPDISGFGNHGANSVGTPVTTNPPPLLLPLSPTNAAWPQSLNFNGTSSAIDVTHAAGKPYDITGPQITMVGWVRWNGKSSENHVINKENSYEMALHYVNATTANLQCAIETDGTGGWYWGPTAGMKTVTANTWTHVACTYSRASCDITTYVNGVKATVQKASDCANITGSAYNLRIGRRDSGYYFGGQLAAVAVYDVALSDAAILAMATQNQVPFASSEANYEYCDGLDNDCSTVTDTDNSALSTKGTSCTGGVGTCQQSGSRVCDNNQFPAYDTNQTWGRTTLCSVTGKANLTACNDSNPCTNADKCNGGDNSTCAGSAFTCPGSCRSCLDEPNSATPHCALTAGNCYIAATACDPTSPGCNTGTCFASNMDPSSIVNSHNNGNASCQYCDTAKSTNAWSIRAATWDCVASVCSGLTFNKTDFCNGTGATCVDAGTTGCDDLNLCTDDSCANATGCANNANTFSRSCYTGPAGTDTKGDCHPGTETCANKAFGACTGQVTPQANEICDSAPINDEDCDGLLNEEGGSGCSTFWKDNDGDGHGDKVAPSSKCLCAASAPYTSTVADDCDDANANAYPGSNTSGVASVEKCNTFDDNCDGTINEECTAGATCTTRGYALYYYDHDVDTYGQTALSKYLCASADKGNAFYTAALSGDCVDDAALSDAGGYYVNSPLSVKVYTKNIKPNSTELCNGLDDNCAGSPAIDEGYSLGTACTKGIAPCDQSGTLICDTANTTYLVTKCSVTGKAAGTACDDGKVFPNCTSGDVCSGGDSSSCSGTPYGCCAGAIVGSTATCAASACITNSCPDPRAQVCTFTVNTSKCFISNTCYNDQDRSAATGNGACLYCNSTANKSAWSNAPNTFQCNAASCSSLVFSPADFCGNATGVCNDTPTQNCDGGSTCQNYSCSTSGCATSNKGDGTACGGETCSGDTWNIKDFCQTGVCKDGGTQNCNATDSVCANGYCQQAPSTPTGCLTQYYSTTTKCSGNDCTGDTYNKQDFCNGAGTCVDAGTTNCNLADGQCADGYCSTGTGCLINNYSTSTACTNGTSNACVGQVWHYQDKCNGSGSCTDNGSLNCDASDTSCRNFFCSGGCPYTDVASGTVCVAASCSGTCSSVAATTCNGAGSCSNGGAVSSCGTNRCVSAACTSSCSANGECCNSGTCIGATCQAKHGCNDTCDAGDGNDCTSGNCVNCGSSRCKANSPSSGWYCWTYYDRNSICGCESYDQYGNCILYLNCWHC